jgi:hypothetical protein
MSALLAMHDMRIVDVTMSLVHGGSIIFVAAPGANASRSEAAQSYASREKLFLTADAFDRFAKRAAVVRSDLLRLIADLRQQAKTVYTYGATAKGNTLLNYCGLTEAEIGVCVDSTPMKQGRFLQK